MRFQIVEKLGGARRQVHPAGVFQAVLLIEPLLDVGEFRNLPLGGVRVELLFADGLIVPAEEIDDHFFVRRDRKSLPAGDLTERFHVHFAVEEERAVEVEE